MQQFARDHGIIWEQFPEFCALKYMLFELETRFLQNNGLFAQMEASGVLEHYAVQKRETLTSAIDTAPEGTRAQVRGSIVKKHAGSKSMRCGWSLISDTNRSISIADPLKCSAKWETKRDRRSSSLRQTLTTAVLSRRPSAITQLVDRLQEEPHFATEMRTTALGHYINGEFANARFILRILLDARINLSGTHVHLARIALIMDELDDAQEHIRKALRIARRHK